MRIDFFRFQLMPLPMQGDLFDGDKKVKNAIKNKNKYFIEAFDSKESFFSKRGKLLPKKLIQAKKHFSIYEIGYHKVVSLKNEELEEDEIDNYPSIYILINNDKDHQVIGISRNSKAFSSSFMVANIIEDNLHSLLHMKALRLKISPILERNKLWSLLEKYQHRITRIRFEIHGINLAKIHDNLHTEMKELIENTQSVKTVFQLESHGDHSLKDINKDNTQLINLTDFTAEGGATAKIKVKGIKKIQKSDNSIKSIEIDEIEMEGDSVSNIKSLNKLLEI